MSKKANLIAVGGCGILTAAATLLGTLTGDTLLFLMIALVGMAGMVFFFKQFTTPAKSAKGRVTSDVVLGKIQAKDVYRTIVFEFHED